MWFSLWHFLKKGSGDINTIKHQVVNIVAHLLDCNKIELYSTMFMSLHWYFYQQTAVSLFIYVLWFLFFTSKNIGQKPNLFSTRKMCPIHYWLCVFYMVLRKKRVKTYIIFGCMCEMCLKSNNKKKCWRNIFKRWWKYPMKIRKPFNGFYDDLVWIYQTVNTSKSILIQIQRLCHWFSFLCSPNRQHFLTQEWMLKQMGYTECVEKQFPLEHIPLAGAEKPVNERIRFVFV